MLWGYNYWSSSCWCWQNMPSLNKSYVSAHSFTLVTVSPYASFKVVWRPRLFCLLGQVGGSWVSSLGFGAKSWTFPWLLKLCILSANQEYTKDKDHVLTLLLPRQLRWWPRSPKPKNSSSHPSSIPWRLFCRFIFQINIYFPPYCTISPPPIQIRVFLWSVRVFLWSVAILTILHITLIVVYEYDDVVV